MQVRGFRVQDHQRERIALGGSCMVDTVDRQTTIEVSDGFEDWLLKENVSLAFSALDYGALYLLGRQSDGKLLISQYGIDHATGIALAEGCLFLGTRRSVVRLRQERHTNIDVFRPIVTHKMVEADIHEIVVDRTGQVLLADAAHSCILALHAFRGAGVAWKPPFITAILPEDRCHLNGLALRDGVPFCVTAFSRRDASRGWRAGLVDEGVVLAVADGRVMVENLVRPHSPRIHGGHLFFLDSGRGALVRVDLALGRQERHAFIPGFLRGLSFHKNFAAVTASRPRDRNFAGLPLDQMLSDTAQEPVAGVFIVDLRTGEIVHQIVFTSGSRELFDVAFLPGIATPAFGQGFVDD